jgi:hypothetical protein
MWARTGYSARATILAHLGAIPSLRSTHTKLLPQPIHRLGGDGGP